MRSKQLNFYAAPEDLPPFEEFFKTQKAVFITLPFADGDSFVRSSMITQTNTREWPKMYLTTSVFLPQIEPHFIQQQGYYLIDEMKNPVLEFSRPLVNVSTGNIERCRFYYIKSYYGENDEVITRDEAFTNWCDMLIKKFAKQFLVKATEVADDKCTKSVLRLVEEGRIEGGTPFRGRYKIVGSRESGAGSQNAVDSR